ncbi:hypothetical protein CORC01_14371 [Colletotrichum orchidophilum]|uniref:Uncharacterized protein n=1 Tax=Colletotrichum orchidophilum TaxID=1209926 RepID=A0A1G4AMD5_9PEZI|nr:uncharacterized protein CORC01_14371 [Colletotrichum orchidophilum]OHE90334.1 hypothetical protein CORC01_14371 [Colletotrichum orchidophilum]
MYTATRNSRLHVPVLVLSSSQPDSHPRPVRKWACWAGCSGYPTQTSLATLRGLAPMTLTLDPRQVLDPHVPALN